MKKKKLYILLTIFLLVLFCTMVLLFIGCKEGIETQMNREMAKQIREQEEAKAEEAEQIAREKQVKQDEAEERALEWDVEEAPAEEPAGEIAVADEEEKLIPNEPITYTSDQVGLDIILIVNFKTAEVTGSINTSGGYYRDSIITNGKINIDTLKISTNFSGVREIDADGNEIPLNGTITGIISDDLSTFDGEILDDEGEGGEFKATR